MCVRCILDETITDIEFDQDGICNFWKIHDELEKDYPLDHEGKVKLDSKTACTSLW